MLKDLIIRNRSVRGYDPSVKIPRDELADMIDCARLSASSRNVQPLKYYISNEGRSVEILNGLIHYGRRLPGITLPFKGTEPPAFIVICLDTSINSSKQIFIRDVGIAAEAITLRAAELGYGACMIGNFSPDEVKAQLGFSEEIDPMLIISIGKSVEDIRLVDLGPDGNTDYYRDDAGTHFVPKRSLEDIILPSSDK
ncbi:MAG: nitroreductase family protein [Mogibacterium sp.]|nr:nitroreductase family protein [Mogibacterium sp.]